MKDYTKFIENLIFKIASSINENFLGLIFLEKLKFDFLENIEELDKKDYEEFLKSIQNDKEYKKTLISGKRNLENRSAIIDACSTMVINKRQLKVYAWYDNEIAYAKRMVDICEFVSESL